MGDPDYDLPDWWHKKHGPTPFQQGLLVVGILVLFFAFAAATARPNLYPLPSARKSCSAPIDVPDWVREAG